ncbi:Uncharacterised protein [Bordetella ansorpii]|uniref:Uncharacterized protein n=1 Tax=Bordetella ansorpii TaxID=288768 RepID=A0A157PAQ1_9BORD|nr:hypothetical protein [Bordetella ansorpii]SAI30782.1 Uncharacterised protein [Bordetella ansorpii]
MKEVFLRLALVIALELVNAVEAYLHSLMASRRRSNDAAWDNRPKFV